MGALAFTLPSPRSSAMSAPAQLSLMPSPPACACGWVLTAELRAKGCVGHMCGEKFVPVREGGAP